MESSPQPTIMMRPREGKTLACNYTAHLQETWRGHWREPPLHDGGASTPEGPPEDQATGTLETELLPGASRQKTEVPPGSATFPEDSGEQEGETAHPWSNPPDCQGPAPGTPPGQG
ncbi:uncharacterized protein LOC106698599 isoform X2 [Myotis lucifugus]|uniref:uncharacterized protein LOC106698599 isoform X2 n=1 Tax=Myotis lucifugus TaxID=59463 RepID=UPI000CCC4D74|nr:uncharacterized protein LOC106698599 isoform X2 [Myotis lucifugus]